MPDRLNYVKLVYMSERFRTVDYQASLNQTVTLAECLPPNHLARFIVAIVALLDLSKIYARYAPVGGVAFAPEVLLGLIFYGYATGVFSSRKMEWMSCSLLASKWNRASYLTD